MFRPTRYLEWARRFYGKVQFDLATSGMPNEPLSAIGLPEDAAMDDLSGWARLREAVATYNDVPVGETIAALGTTQAIWLAYAALCEPGDEVLVEHPAYEPLLRTAEGIGARVTRFERRASDRFALDPELVARSLTPRTRVVVVTNLHNPSGVRASDDVIRAIARIAEARGASLLVDEVYAPFDTLVDAHRVFRRSARKLAANVVAVGSLTKCYGLGPQRIGWMLAASEIVARAEAAMIAGCGALPLPHAHIALRAFDDLARLAQSSRDRLAGKRERVAAWVKAQGLSWSSPAEGLFGFVTMPSPGDLTAAIEAAACDREVLVAPGAFFDHPAAFRIAWSAPVDILEEGLGRLAEALAPLLRSR